MDIDFGELAKDSNLVAKVQTLHKTTDDINDLLKLTNDPELYSKLSNSDKLKYNLLMSYSLNTLFWMYLRLEGQDPMKHEIKSENDRLKQYMVRAKQIKDRETIMPRVNREVAKIRQERSVGLEGPQRQKQQTEGTEEIGDSNTIRS